jgi:hypothetical protein
VFFPKIIDDSTRKFRREFKWKRANDDPARSFVRSFCFTLFQFYAFFATAVFVFFFEKRQNLIRLEEKN